MDSAPYPPDIWFDIDTLIAVAQPQSMLVLGDADISFLDDYKEQQLVLGKQLNIVSIGAEQIDDIDQIDQQFDVAVVAQLLETLDKNSSTRILSRLRDVLSKQFCVCLNLTANETSSWSRTDFFALGLRRVNTYDTSHGEHALFSYRLKDYKNTPDWLNADNWANPEMWGKYWW